MKIPKAIEASKTAKSNEFNPQAFLDSAGLARKIKEYRKAETIFSQGDPCKSVMYVQRGEVRLSVVSKTGKEAVVAILGPGDFVGEGALAGQPVRMATATAATPATLLVIDIKEMNRVLLAEPALSYRFITYILERNIRIEEDLIDQLFNSSERRLARLLLLLARFGEEGLPETLVPKISQQTLAEMIGTTRSRVSFFMNRFRDLGFVEYDENGIQVHSSLLNVILHD